MWEKIWIPAVLKGFTNSAQSGSGDMSPYTAHLAGIGSDEKGNQMPGGRKSSEHQALWFEKYISEDQELGDMHGVTLLSKKTGALQRSTGIELWMAASSKCLAQWNGCDVAKRGRGGRRTLVLHHCCTLLASFGTRTVIVSMLKDRTYEDAL